MVHNHILARTLEGNAEQEGILRSAMWTREEVACSRNVILPLVKKNTTQVYLQSAKFNNATTSALEFPYLCRTLQQNYFKYLEENPRQCRETTTTTTTVENKGNLILTEIFPSVQKHDIF